MRCSEASNNPPVNFGGQLYGAGSRCFQLGRDWTTVNDNGIDGVYAPDAGCYMVSSDTRGNIYIYICFVLCMEENWLLNYEIQCTMSYSQFPLPEILCMYCIYL